MAGPAAKKKECPGAIWERALANEESCDVLTAIRTEAGDDAFYAAHPGAYARALIWNAARGRCAVVRFLLRHGGEHAAPSLFVEAWAAACGAGHLETAKMLESQITADLPEEQVIADAFPETFDRTLLEARRAAKFEVLAYLRGHDLDWHEDDAQEMYCATVRYRSPARQPYQ